MSINRVVLTGRLTKDLELRATPSGASVTSFTVAVDGLNKDQETSFIECVAWNKQAEFLTTYCKKGSLVAVEGRLQKRSYDRKDGTTAYVTEVIADRVENLSPRDKATPNPTVKENTPPTYNDNPFDDNQTLNYSDDDLPF